MNLPVITVGREYGSGGRWIAQHVAEALGLPFYDNRLIVMAAERSGLSEDFVRNVEEHRSSLFLYNMYFSAGNLPVHDQVFIAEAQVILRVAEEGPCVILGRCADYVLRERENCLHVFVHAPLEARVRRAEREYGVPGDARAFVAKYDKARASYYNHFTTEKWGHTRNYHLTIDSSIGLARAAETILAAARCGEEGREAR